MTASDAPVAAPDEPAAAGEDRILTIPNLITLVRLSCLPVFLWLLFDRDDPGAAALLLLALGGTDWVDGYIARHFHQVSTLGKVLDPVADRLLFFVGAGGILIYGAVPAWFAWMVLVREITVAAVTIGLAALGAKRIDVTWYGKAGTFCLMIAFPLFLGSAADTSIQGVLRFCAWGWGIPGLVFSYVSWAMYVPIARRALAEGRAARAASTGAP